MLETRIEELTAAVKALTEVIISARSVAQAVENVKLPEGLKEPKAKKETPKAADVAANRQIGESMQDTKKRLEKDGVPEAPADIPNEKQPTTTDTSSPSESESAPVTYDDVKKATNALSAAKGRDVTIDALSRFGVKRATELDEGQWADYIAYAEKVTADE